MGPRSWASTTATCPAQRRTAGVVDESLRRSMESLNVSRASAADVSVAGSGGAGSAPAPAQFASAAAQMPPRVDTGGSSALRSSFRQSNSGRGLSPAAEHLAKISSMYKSGEISERARSQLKAQLYMSLSQER